MMTIDRYAQTSRLRAYSPGLKAGFALLSLFACLLAGNNVFSLCIFVVMSLACTAVSGLAVKPYLRLCGIPFFFVLVGTLTIAVGFSGEPVGIWNLPVFGSFLVITSEGLTQALGMFFRSMAGISCLYFLYVSTPVNHLLGLLWRMHVPQLLLELMMMIYRFIFILVGMAEQISTAQKARLGNVSRRATLRSATVLATTVFVGALQKSNLIYNAMESRGYTGSFAFTGELTAARLWQRLALGGYALALVAFLIFARIAG